MQSNSTEKPDHYFVFLDLETTGLNPKRDSILEIGMVVVSADRVCDQDTPLDVFHSLVGAEIVPSYIADEVVKMHTESGLWLDVIRAGRKSVKEIEDEALDFLHEHCGDAKLTLAGFGVHFDLAFLRGYMPRLAAEFHYRLADVSAAYTVLGIERPKTEGDARHRAVPDCLAAVSSMIHLRRLVNPQPAATEAPPAPAADVKDAVAPRHGRSYETRDGDIVKAVYDEVHACFRNYDDDDERWSSFGESNFGERRDLVKELPLQSRPRRSTPEKGETP